MQQQIDGAFKVGGLLRGFDVEHALHQPAELLDAFVRRHEAAFGVGEGEQAGGIAVLERGVREQQHRLQGVVEMAFVAHLQAHVAAAVEQEKELLVLFVLIGADDGAAHARGGFPVDIADVVAVLVVAQLVEVLAEAEAGQFFHADQIEPALQAD